MIQNLLEVQVNANLLLPKDVKTWAPPFNRLPIIATYSLSSRKAYLPEVLRCHQRCALNTDEGSLISVSWLIVHIL
jgi:hypothetical protein